MNTDVNNAQMCEKLWNEYEPTLRKICQNRLASCPSEIDDVISETYFALCRNIDSGELIHNPKAWLYGTLNNIIKTKYSEINKIRKNQISLTNRENELYYNVDFDGEKISYELIEKIKYSIIEQLDVSEKNLIDLIYVKRLKFKEVADILNISESAVKQKIYRLKRKIKLIAKKKIEKL